MSTFKITSGSSQNEGTTTDGKPMQPGFINTLNAFKTTEVAKLNEELEKPDNRVGIINAIEDILLFHKSAVARLIEINLPNVLPGGDNGQTLKNGLKCMEETVKLAKEINITHSELVFVVRGIRTRYQQAESFWISYAALMAQPVEARLPSYVAKFVKPRGIPYVDPTTVDPVEAEEVDMGPNNQPSSMR